MTTGTPAAIERDLAPGLSAGEILVEVLGPHDRVLARSRFAALDGDRVILVGRGAMADIVLDDDYAAVRHAEIRLTPEGEVRVTDLGSVNGICIGGKRLRGLAQHRLEAGEIQIGRTRLRIRTDKEKLPAEKRDEELRGLRLRHPAWAALAGVLVGVGFIAHASWVGAPRDFWSSFVSALMPATLTAGLWIAVWSLISRVSTGEWRWLRNAAVFFVIAALYYATEAALELAGFAFSLPAWENQGTILGAIFAALFLTGHLANTSRLSRRHVFVLAWLLPALALAALLWVRARDELLNVNRISERHTLYPPGFRVREAGSIEDYFARATQLKQEADRRRKAMPRGLQGGEEDWDGDD